MKNTERYLRWFKILGVVLFAFIVTRLDFRAILVQLESFRVEWLGVYVACFVMAIILKGLRWRSVVTKQGLAMSLWRFLAITIVASFLGIVTPGRFGEYSRVLYLSRENFSMGKSLASVILDRLYDISFLMTFGVLAVIYFSSLFFPGFVMLMTYGGAFVAILGFLYFFRHRLWDLLNSILRRILSPRSYASVKDEWETFKSELRSVFVPTLVPMTILSLGSYAFYFAQIYAVSKGFGVDVSFVYLSLCLAASALISMVPISVGGLGTREATFIALLGKVSVTPETATLVAFIDGTVLSLLLGGVLALISYKILKEGQIDG
jgi:uncharacterized protein (TIRG00374 family)